MLEKDANRSILAFIVRSETGPAVRAQAQGSNRPPCDAKQAAGLAIFCVIA